MSPRPGKKKGDDRVPFVQAKENEKHRQKRRRIHSCREKNGGDGLEG
jgi:hypothetical protein